MFELGSVLATRYRILELLGEGGMGAVYRARDLTLGEDVAVKLLDPELAEDPGRVDYFRNEVLLARKVTHPNVCRLHDIACEDGHWFITMEYIEGESLADKLRNDSSTKDNVEMVGRIFREVARGLAAAHEVGVVHRDLKPDNIMLSAGTGRAVVADFGIAVELNQLGHAAVDRAGTRGYMSPEQAAGRDIDARTDVFALGVLGHRMLTGELPWVAPSRVSNTDVGGPAPEIADDVPERFATVLARCLELDPDDRPRDAGAVLELLDGEPEIRAPRRRWPALAALAAIVVFAGIAAVFGVASRSSRLALSFDTPRIVVEAVNTSGLDAKLRWYDDAFARRVVNELEDAWAVGARTSDDPGRDARLSDLAVAITLRRGDGGQLIAELARRQQGRASSIEVQGESFQELAEATAASLVEFGIPAELQRPFEAELEGLGIRSVSAWRDFRRAQRASLRQEWSKVRAIAGRAIENDDQCVPCLVEYAWSFGDGDDARLPYLRRVLEISKSLELPRAWQRIVDFVDADVAGDQKRKAELVGEVLSLEWSRRHRRYLSYRAAAVLWFGGLREVAVPKLELHIEQHPRISGVAKLLAEHYLDLDGEQEREQALRYATLAVSIGPDDLANRAQLARAHMRFGRRDEALAQVEIIESAGPDEKRFAVAGGERTNSLFDMYMALDDHRGASQAARRLYNGTPREQGAASEALAYLAYMRGDNIGGRRLHEQALEKFRDGALTQFEAGSTRKMLWIRFALGNYRGVLELLEAVPVEQVGAHYPVLEALARYHLASGRKKRALLDDVEARIAALVSPVQRASFELIVAIERGQWKRALALENIVRAGRSWISAYAYLAIAAEKLGDIERAARLHEQLATHRFAWTEPIRAPASRLEAGRLREALGETARAIEHYDAYVRQLDKAPPSHPGLAQARKRLEALR